MDEEIVEGMKRVSDFCACPCCRVAVSLRQFFPGGHPGHDRSVIADKSGSPAAEDGEVSVKSAARAAVPGVGGLRRGRTGSSGARAG